MARKATLVLLQRLLTHFMLGGIFTDDLTRINVSEGYQSSEYWLFVTGILIVLSFYLSCAIALKYAKSKGTTQAL